MAKQTIVPSPAAPLSGLLALHGSRSIIICHTDLCFLMVCVWAKEFKMHGVCGVINSDLSPWDTAIMISSKFSVLMVNVFGVNLFLLHEGDMVCCAINPFRTKVPLGLRLPLWVYPLCSAPLVWVA